MNKITAKRFAANIGIKPTQEIEIVAKSISDALTLELNQNKTGKFEEFIGYEGEALGMSINLIANPQDPDEYYDLDIYGTSKEDGETIDITNYILSVLNKKTDLVCKKMD